MTTLASSSDLIVDGYEAAAVEGALSWATSTIEGYCLRTFALVTGDTVKVTPHHGTGMLPNYPVVNITSVEGYMLDLDTGAYAWVPLTNYWLDDNTGIIYNTTGLAGVIWTGVRTSSLAALSMMASGRPVALAQTVPQADTCVAPQT